jgi:hypothetical protein
MTNLDKSCFFRSYKMYEKGFRDNNKIKAAYSFFIMFLFIYFLFIVVYFLFVCLCFVFCGFVP